MLSRGRREDKRMLLVFRRYGRGKRFLRSRRPLENMEKYKLSQKYTHALKAKESGQKAAVQ
jgi:hypothetical protein